MAAQQLMRDSSPVPKILPLLIDHFHKLDGDHCKGIFRLAASRDAVLKAQAEIEAGEAVC